MHAGFHSMASKQCNEITEKLVKMYVQKPYTYEVDNLCKLSKLLTPTKELQKPPKWEKSQVRNSFSSSLLQQKYKMIQDLLCGFFAYWNPNARKECSCCGRLRQQYLTDWTWSQAFCSVKSSESDGLHYGRVNSFSKDVNRPANSEECAEENCYHSCPNFSTMKMSMC